MPRPAAGMEVEKTPPWAPKANAFAERWMRTARTECLDWMLIWNRRHLENVLAAYVRHYNTARPHRGLNLDVPAARGEPTPANVAQIDRIDASTFLVGLSASIATRPYDVTSASPDRTANGPACVAVDSFSGRVDRRDAAGSIVGTCFARRQQHPLAITNCIDETRDTTPADER
jgi:hypothetical protein